MIITNKIGCFQLIETGIVLWRLHRDGGLRSNNPNLVSNLKLAPLLGQTTSVLLVTRGPLRPSAYSVTTISAIDSIYDWRLC